MDSALILIVSILLALIPAGVSLWRGKPDFFAPASIFAFGYTASYGLKAFLLTLDSDIWISYPDKTTDLSFLNIGFVLSCAGLLSFYAGYYWCSVPKWMLPQSSYSDVEHKIAKGFSSLLILASMFSGLMLLYVIRLDLRDIFSIEFAAILRSAAMTSWEDNPAIFQIPVWIGFFALVSIHSTREMQGTEGRTQALLTRKSVAVIVTATIVLGILGSRALLLTFFLSLLLYRHYYIRRVGIGIQLLSLVVVILIAAYFGIIQKIDEHVGITAMQLQFPTNIIYRLSSSYEQFEVFIDTVSIDPPIQWGQTIFEDVVYTYIPRVLWPGKPTDFGFLRAQNFVFADYWDQSHATTYPLGAVAELYLNFGFPGIFFGMSFLGALLSRLGKNSIGASSNYPVVFAVVVASFLAPHRTFGTVLMSIMLYLAFGVFVSKVASIFRKSRSSSGDTVPAKRLPVAGLAAHTVVPNSSIPPSR